MNIDVDDLEARAKTCLSIDPNGGMAIYASEVMGLIAEVRRMREEKAGLLGACRFAVLALANASESSPMYRSAYNHVSAAIDATRFEE